MKKWLSFVTVLLILTLASSSVFADEHYVSTLFYETDLREAINELVLQTGVNIIPDATVSGVITLDLDNVPLERALMMMLIGGGFTYKKIDNFYVVGLPDPRGAMFQHLAETATVRLENVSASEARDLLPTIYDRYIKSSQDSQMLTINAPPVVIERFIEDVRKIDLAKRQVIVQAIVTEVSSEAFNEWGANMFNFEVGKNTEYNSEWVSIFGVNNENFGIETNVFGNLVANLRLLEGENQAKIQANPRILVADRATANLFVGDTQHIILEPTGGTARLEKVDVGVSLKVTPRILSNGEISLTISPEISHLTSEGNKGLVVRRNELSSTVFVQDGQTIVLAGMSLESEKDNVKKFPVLGDIPLLRWFFRQASDSVGSRELLIFISTEIVNREHLQ